jgi:Recombinational DNA repair protein (RecE pathway)
MADNEALVKSPAQKMEELTNRTLDNIAKMVEENPNLTFPKGYDAPSEVRSAMLHIMNNVKDRNGKPALEVCTGSSIALAMRNMVIQGLSIAKGQTYAIVYGNTLILQNSYMGDLNVFYRIFPNLDVVAHAIFEGDTFDIKVLEDGSSRIVNYQTSFENKDNKIIGAYGNIVDRETRKVIDCDYMTAKQITASWGQSKVKATQEKFPEEMTRRTMIRRLVKRYIRATVVDGSASALATAYLESQKDESIEDEPINVTPSNAQKSVKGRSRGSAGLADFLASEATDVVADEVPNTEQKPMPYSDPEEDTTIFDQMNNEEENPF